MKRQLYIALSTLLLASCSVQPEAIDYGAEQCYACRMTIVDQQHAAQFVTNKGKQYKFDAIECMIEELGNKQDDMAFILVADYAKAGNMLEAKMATYIICPAIKSPMGEFLSAFSTEDQAKKMLDVHGGKHYTWTEIKAYLNEK